jgi:outer membrane protein, heavy metal efflux system
MMKLIQYAVASTVVAILLPLHAMGEEPTEKAESSPEATETADRADAADEAPIPASDSAKIEVDATMTLERALDLAAQKHPDHAYWRFQMDASEGRAHQAGRYPNPQLSTRIESAPFNGKTTGDAEYLAGFSQEIVTAGKLAKAQRVESADRERINSEQSAGWLEIRKKVHSAFAAALYLSQLNAFQEETVKSTEQSVSITTRRKEAGDATPQDVARVEMELVRAKMEREKAVSLQKQALSELAFSIGDGALNIKAVEGQLDQIFEIPTIEQIAANLDQHPRLLTLRAQSDVDRARIDLARAQRVPNINAELLYRRIQSERRDAFDAGISISVPLFDGGKGRIREAQANLAATEARTQSTRLSIESDMRAAHQVLTRALATAKVLKEDLLPRADQVLKTAESRYSAGDISLSEILPIRRERAQLHLNYLDALRDVMAAWSDLRPLISK